VKRTLLHSMVPRNIPSSVHIDPFASRKPHGRVARAALLILGLLILPGVVLPQSGSDAALDQVLKQMEEVGKNFRSFRAHFTQKKYTLVLKEFDAPETGEFFYARARDGSALLRQEATSPAPRILTIKGGTAVVYQPKIRQAQLVHLGKNKDKAEYLALGLGQSPGKLRAAFDINSQGTESVGGVSCWILSLKPKSSAAAAFFTSITLWIKKASGIPIQQKLQEPNGDYLLVNFSGEKLNTPLPMSEFEQKLPKDVDLLTIQ
jgi:outer membrane lipoprotein-sorting protein